MPSLVTHLVVGERVFAQAQRFAAADYGAFLAGCVLVDVNGFSTIDRRTTHFVRGFEEDGASAFEASCARFLVQRDTLLRRPWEQLTTAEQTFVAGYLCHLAADEGWKRFTRNLLQALGIPTPADLPVPGGVLMTASSVLSSRMLFDLPAIVSALRDPVIPDVLTHVPHEAFRRMWDIVQEHLVSGDTPESFFRMLVRLGRTEAEIQAIRQRHERYWDEAVALIQANGGIEPSIQAGVQRSLEVLPLLWAAS